MSTSQAVTIKRRFDVSLAVLASGALIQAGGFAYMQYTHHALVLEQQRMTSITTHQMFGDMKHDAIQSDVFRLVDASARGDRVKIGEAQPGMDKDIDDLARTYDFVFARIADIAATGDAALPAAMPPAAQKTRADRDDFIDKERALAARIEQPLGDTTAALDAFATSFDRFGADRRHRADSLDHRDQQRIG